MKRLHKPALMVLIAMTAFLPGCATQQAEEAADSGLEIAAYVADEPITMAELEQEAESGLAKINQERYDLFRRTLDAMAAEKMLAREAKSRGMTPEALLAAEIDNKAVPPSDKNIQEFYELNKDRMGGKSLEQMHDDLATYLLGQQKDQLRYRLFSNLRTAHPMRVLLDPPRTDIPLVPGEPARGPEDAPVTIVEFADFQCPYCRRAHPVMQRLLTEYGDKIRFVFRDFPLANHRRAVPASEAARCANDQGKFWDYYENLMVMVGDLGDEDLKKRAEEVGLNTDEFMACLRSGRYTEIVEQGVAKGQSVGVGSTPTFFINGRMIVGAKPYDEFKTVVEEELSGADVAEEEENVGG